MKEVVTHTRRKRRSVGSSIGPSPSFCSLLHSPYKASTPRLLHRDPPTSTNGSHEEETDLI